jgi:hypothetical protein
MAVTVWFAAATRGGGAGAKIAEFGEALGKPFTSLF